MESRWYRISILYVVPHELVEHVSAKLEAAGERVAIEPTTAEFFDYPGPAFAQRAEDELDLGGLTLKVPAADVGRLLQEVETAPSNGPALEIHGAVRVLVLGPEQRQVLHRELRRISKTAEQQAWVEGQVWQELPETEKLSLSPHRSRRH